MKNAPLGPFNNLQLNQNANKPTFLIALDITTAFALMHHLNLGRFLNEIHCKEVQLHVI